MYFKNVSKESNILHKRPFFRQTHNKGSLVLHVQEKEASMTKSAEDSQYNVSLILVLTLFSLLHPPACCSVFL